MKNSGVIDWLHFLHPHLEDILLRKIDFVDIAVIEDENKLPDSAIKFRLHEKKRPVAFILCARSRKNDCIGRAIEASVKCKQLLSSNLGQHVLAPLSAGERFGRHWAIFPYCNPLSDNRYIWLAQRSLLRNNIFNWLCDVAKETGCTAKSDEIENYFIKPLDYIARLNDLSSTIIASAKAGLHAMMIGAFKPRFTLMQGDFWKGNLLIDSQFAAVRRNSCWSKRFVVIDWAGAKIKGYPFYDYVRFALSFRLKGRRLVDSTSLLSHRLECSPAMGRYYLLAALGNLALHLEHFPYRHFIALAESCYHKLENAIE